MKGISFAQLGLLGDSSEAAHPEPTALFWITHEEMQQNLVDAEARHFSLEPLSPDQMRNGQRIRDMLLNGQKHFLMAWNRRYPELVCTFL